MTGVRRRDTIVVADADSGFREQVSALLGDAGYEASEAATGPEALEAARRLRPRLVVLDVGLPEICSYEVCRKLRDEFGAGLAVMFVSAERTEPSDRIAGLLLGADDYLAKPVAFDELLARVRALLRRSSPMIATASALTTRELEILRLLADGLTGGDIARHLFISRKTVGTHIEHILRKLGVHSRTEAVALAYRDGLVGAGT
jgi:two-component system, NarL family, nitrate/nitrite response regulator NarL